MIGNGKVGVVGAGMMGSEIARVFALAGRDVVIADRDAGLAEKARERIAGVLEKGSGRGFWSAEDAAGALARLAPAAGYEDFADRALVVEAVFEDEEVKAEAYRRLDPILAPDCIVASNTSSIAISVLASFFPEARRGRFLGTHFFSPVSRMKLIEVIPGLDTQDEIVDAVIEEMGDIGKTPVRVKDVVGFAPLAQAVERVFGGPVDSVVDAALSGALALLARHGEALSRMITHRLPLYQASAAFELARARRAVKILLAPGAGAPQTGESA